MAGKFLFLDLDDGYKSVFTLKQFTEVKNSFVFHFIVKGKITNT